MTKRAGALLLMLGLCLMGPAWGQGKAWWNADWPYRKQITVDASAAGANIAGSPENVPVLVRLDRITSVRVDPPGGHGLPGGSRFPALELSLVAALSLLAEERWPVNLALAAGDQVAGDLVAVGHDLLTVREHDGPRRSVLVPLAALDYCELR